MIKYAKCNMVITSALGVKPTRRRMGKVNVNVLTGMSAGPQPVKLVIKGTNIRRVTELMTLYSRPDAELVELVRSSPWASEVKGKTEEEIAAQVRKDVLEELREMASGDS